jgi:uncharacterized membrane protein YoaK (UPF0700 family)
VAVLLSASGGFLDAFTWVGHGQVFANAMTGNVVLLAVWGASGHWGRAFRHVPPICAFLLGVFLSHLMGQPTLRRRLARPALTCLSLEIIFLLIVSILPPAFPDALLVPGVALVAALQNTSFTHLGPWAYNSVMTTGNLRQFAQSLYQGTFPQRDPRALRQARIYGTICFCFFVGAAIGSLATPRLHNAALWLPAAALAVALYLCRGGGPGDNRNDRRLA